MPQITCSTCKGEGATAKGRCHACGGVGYTMGGDVEVAVNPMTVWKIRIVCRCGEAFIFGIPDEVIHLVTRKINDFFPCVSLTKWIFPISTSI